MHIINALLMPDHEDTGKPLGHGHAPGVELRGGGGGGVRGPHEDMSMTMNSRRRPTATASASARSLYFLNTSRMVCAQSTGS